MKILDDEGKLKTDHVTAKHEIPALKKRQVTKAVGSGKFTYRTTVLYTVNFQPGLDH